MNQHLSPNSGTPDPQTVIAQLILSKVALSDKALWKQNGSFLQVTDGNETIQVGIFVREASTEVSVELQTNAGTVDEERVSLAKKFSLTDDRLFTLADPLVAIAKEALDHADMEQDFREALSLNAEASSLLADIASETIDVTQYDWEYSINVDTQPLSLVFKTMIQGCEVSLEYNPEYYSSDYQLRVDPKPLVSTDNSLHPSREGWIAMQALFPARVSEAGLQGQFEKLLDKDSEAAGWLS